MIFFTGSEVKRRNSGNKSKLDESININSLPPVDRAIAEYNIQPERKTNCLVM